MPEYTVTIEREIIATETLNVMADNKDDVIRILNQPRHIVNMGDMNIKRQTVTSIKNK